MKIKTLILSAALLVLGACTHNTQTTSGQEYLKQYAQNDAYRHLSEVDTEIYDIANIEPDLRFPARIGLARIGNPNPYSGTPKLTSIPGDESEIWAELVQREGSRYGEFVPVSPLIASMVNRNSTGARNTNGSVDNIVANIRKGAARQHLDYVLIYEVTDTDKRTSNNLSFTDATVLGLFLIPSRKVKVDTIASAVLVDVRNGYPYATATSFSELGSTTTKYGSSSKREKLKDKGRLKAVEGLSEHVEAALRDLKDAAYDKLVAEGY